MPNDAMPAGWFQDPTGRHEARYFDGRVWTANVSDQGQLSTDSPLPPPGAASTSDIAAPVAQATGLSSGLRAGMIASGAAVAVGSLMPWVSTFGGAISVAGTSGDGAFTLVLGGAIVGLSVWGRWLWASLVCGVLSAAIAGYDLADISGTDGVEVGSGLWITFLGAVAAVVVSIVAMVGRPR